MTLSPPTDPRPRGAAARLVHALRTSAELLAVAYRASPAAFLGTVGLQAVQGLLPLASAWVIKRIFDLLALRLGAGGGPGELGPLAWLLGAQAGVLLAQQGLAPVAAYLQGELGRRLALLFEGRIYHKVNSLEGLAPFESPRFQDTLRLAQGGAASRPLEVMGTLTLLLRAGLTVAGFLTAFLAFSPTLAVLLALAVLPQLYFHSRMSRQRHRLAGEISPRERRAFTLRFALSTDRFAKEIRLFGLGAYFLDALLGIQREIHDQRRDQERRHLGTQLLLDAGGAAVSAAAFLAVVLLAFRGRLTLGDVTFFTAAAASVQGALLQAAAGVAGLGESLLFYRHYTELIALPQPIRVEEPGLPVPPLATGVTLSGVSFRYGEDRPWVLRDLHLHLPAGKCVALVGANGAGKSTVAKLLTRLYDPTEGRITWEGEDLLRLDLTQLRRRISSVFQDFARFDLTARENIGVGDVAAVDDRARIRRAAHAAGIGPFLEALPDGYETFLNRWLSEEGKGTDLSGGQWQKVAIARMLMREADLLLLDEPTAALDPEAEEEIFRHFSRLLAGRTSLLVTHRFTTVAMADLIAVLDGGRITEYGTPEELLARGGTYARLYRLQASRFRTPRSEGNREAGREVIAG